MPNRSGRFRHTGSARGKTAICCLPGVMNQEKPFWRLPVTGSFPESISSATRSSCLRSMELRRMPSALSRLLYATAKPARSRKFEANFSPQTVPSTCFPANGATWN